MKKKLVLLSIWSEGMYLVCCHSNILKDEGAMEEEEVVGVGREGGAQSFAECCVCSNGEGTLGADSNVELQITK